MHLHDKAFYVALFFIIGVAAAGLGVNVWLTLFAATVASFVAIRSKIFVALFVGITFLGFFYFNFYTVSQNENFPVGEKIEFEGVVYNQPKHGLKSQELNIELENPYIGAVRVYTEPLPRFQYGDVVKITGTITESPSGKLNIVSFPDIERTGVAEDKE